MTEKASDERKVMAVVNSYIESFYEADVDQLRKIFADNASMNGYLDGNLLEGTPEPFFQDVASKPSLKSEGLKIVSNIEHLSITGNVAAIVVKEIGFGPFDFTDYLHLLKKDGEWKIISKTFTTC